MRRWDAQFSDPAQAGFAYRKPYAQAARRSASDRYRSRRHFDYGRGMAAIGASCTSPLPPAEVGLLNAHRPFSLGGGNG